MNEKTLHNICSQIAHNYGYTLDIPVTINSRLSSTLGRVMYRKKGSEFVPIRIEFSRDLLQSGDDSLIMDTIKHEMAHFFVLKDTKKNHNHDEYWKRWAKILGCSPKASIKVTDNNEFSYKYKIVCSKCGQIVGLKKRASDVVKNPWKYRSSCCNEKLDVYVKVNKF